MDKHLPGSGSIPSLLEQRGKEIEVMFNLSQSVSAGFDRRVLGIVLELIELGVHPESISDIIEEIRNKESN